jgi:hypothetical protein
VPTPTHIQTPTVADVAAPMASRRIVSATMLEEEAAAAYLGFQPVTLRAWRRQGRGPAYIRTQRAIRYSRADLDAWLILHRVETRESLGAERA